MLLDSHSTKSPSRSTGTCRFGFSAASRSAGGAGSWRRGRSSPAHSHSTLRTLMEVGFRTERAWFWRSS
ncbi:hypothetical protein VM57_19710 [Stenotrophomonas maltophilia]|uniref:Uncharacterized protein n=1 Tax=Stenotrophomonas maltophilia TaxID=40324 RepID=A0A0F5ZMC1_STEMA|nr:hypothetical protein VM57_19710 [Stenotrophomonas maltophilia]